MNLELIRKYEKEFLHMLYGGTLLFHSRYHGGWHTLPGDYQWDNDYGFVINDEYVEFRKALADGKTIEERYYTPTDHWGKHLSGFAISPKMLRIKPKEPEFKIGDYVRYIHANSPKPLQIVNINCERYYFENAKIILRLDEIEKWEPREGEVCIFWNNDSNTAVIAKLRYIVSTGTYRTEHSNWDNCMPFTGALPPHIKD